MRNKHLRGESLRQHVIAEPELSGVAAGGATEVERPRRIRVLDHAKHEQVGALQQMRGDDGLNVARTIGGFASRLEHHRLIDLPIGGNRVRFVERHPQRWRRGLLPLAAPVYIGSLRRVVVEDRTPDDLPRVPVGVQQRRIRDDHVLANPFDLLRIPEREGVVVADGDEHTIRLDGIQQIVGEVACVRLATARRTAKVCEERHDAEKKDRRRLEQVITSREH